MFRSIKSVVGPTGSTELNWAERSPTNRGWLQPVELSRVESSVVLSREVWWGLKRRTHWLNGSSTSILICDHFDYDKFYPN